MYAIAPLCHELSLLRLLKYFLRGIVMKHPPCVVAIAGTDPSGGAGIQADIKAISATGAYAASIVTALVAQNTCGVQAIQPVSPEFLRIQLQSVFDDLAIKAVKIGMVHEAPIIKILAAELETQQAPFVIFDPVMVAKDGSLLLDLTAINLLKNQLLSKAYLVTPNLPEAEYLLKNKISSLSDMEHASRQIGLLYQTNVLIKGGHLNTSSSSDVLYQPLDDKCSWYHTERIQTNNTHGTGCTLSSAIASYLAQDLDLQSAIRMAKEYLSAAIVSGANHAIGQGNGPVDHFYFLRNSHHGI